MAYLASKQLMFNDQSVSCGVDSDLCNVLPDADLTDKAVSIDPAISATATVTGTIISAFTTPASGFTLAGPTFLANA